MGANESNEKELEGIRPLKADAMKGSVDSQLDWGDLTSLFLLGLVSSHA